MKKRVVLVGGGHAHLLALASYAARPPEDVDIILITPSRWQTYSGMLPGWIYGRYTAEDCRIDLIGLVKRSGARIILQRVVSIEAASKRVSLDNGDIIIFDILSLDIGSQTNTSSLAPLGPRLLPVKPLDQFFQDWPGVLAAAQKKPSFTLDIVGGGAAGVEIALAAVYALENVNPSAKINLWIGDSGILPEHGPVAQHKMKQCLLKNGVNVRHFSRPVADDSERTVGIFTKSDCVIAATGAAAPAWLSGSGLSLDDQGFVCVDRYHRSLSHASVFAAGDICSRHDVQLARSGVHAVRVGPILGANLLAAIRSESLQPYMPRASSMYLLACGPAQAVMSWGGWSFQGAWVGWLKDFIDRRFVRRHS